VGFLFAGGRGWAKTRKEIAMSDAAKLNRKSVLSLDAWAVILALTLAGLVRIGLVKHITW
jgi:hypothetical protein